MQLIWMTVTWGYVDNVRKLLEWELKKTLFFNIEWNEKKSTNNEGLQE